MFRKYAASFHRAGDVRLCQRDIRDENNEADGYIRQKRQLRRAKYSRSHRRNCRTRGGAFGLAPAATMMEMADEAYHEAGRGSG